MRYVVKDAGCDQDFLLMQHTRSMTISAIPIHATRHAKTHREATSLSRYAIEVFLVSLGLLACRPDDAVFVVRRTVDGVQL